MARVWLTFGMLTPLLAIFIAQRTSLAQSYWPWFLAIHPDSAQTTEKPLRGVSHGSDLTQKLSQDGQQPFQVSTPPLIIHHASDAKDAFVRRIVAVGDLHGDFGNARKVLEMSGVIDEGGKWTGQVDFFVQTGDIIDR